jgi:hypothetical protein
MKEDSRTIPVIFFGNGNPMNAVTHNGYTCLTEEAEIWPDASPAALMRRPLGAG